MKRWWCSVVALPFLGVVALATASCGQLGAVDRAACPELFGGDALSGRFSANARAQGKVAAFVQASADLMAVSNQMEAEAADACMRMGRDLGLTQQQMAPQQGAGGRAAGACNAVGARIDAIMRAGAGVRVTVTPPHCQASADAEARCNGQCDVSVDPGQIVAQCEPARLSGFCQGRCDGRCDGRCQGQCQGQCSAVDAQGRCVGQCNGTCSGACDATCHAHCSGQWQAPKCEGTVRPPSADAECNASCHAHADVRASCSPAVVNVQATANAEAAMRLAATLQANLPQLLHAEIALGKRLAGDVQVVGQVGAQLPKIIGNAGAHAMACVGAATDVTAQASVRINVSVRASANVSGRVGASGG